jgi:hypothetical protein
MSIQTMNHLVPPTGVVLAAALTACAQTPSTPAKQTAALDCAALEVQIETAVQQQRAAAQQQNDAWKAVVPFAVMARYGQGKAAASDSRQRLDELQRHAALRGCSIPAH